MKYTEKIHAEGLLEIFEKSEPMRRCPVGLMGWKLGVINWSNRLNVCEVCWGFIGYSNIEIWTCPCMVLDEYSKYTWLALEEKGYLE